VAETSARIEANTFPANAAVQGVRPSGDVGWATALKGSSLTEEAADAYHVLHSVLVWADTAQDTLEPGRRAYCNSFQTKPLLPKNDR
jgi:hypothetical protein